MITAREKESLERLETSSSESRAEIQAIVKEQDIAGLKKGEHVMKHIEQINQIIACSEELDEAEIRRIEAGSDVHALRERNSDIVANLETERTRLGEIEAQSKRATLTARAALERCKDIRREAEERDDHDSLEYFSSISPDRTVETLQQEINSEEHKLDFIQANNPNAIREYEKRQVDIGRLNTRIAGTEGELGDVAQKVTQIMTKWEPRLDALVEQISQAFSHNFEQIGCAGEVSVYKEDDFEKWAIEIKVKFRYSHFIKISQTCQPINIITEKTKPFSSLISIVNPEVNAPFPQFSTSCLYNHWLALPSASSTKSTKEWILVTNEWSMDVWSRLHVRNMIASTFLLRRSYYMI